MTPENLIQSLILVCTNTKLIQAAEVHSAFKNGFNFTELSSGEIVNRETLDEEIEYVEIHYRNQSKAIYISLTTAGASYIAEKFPQGIRYHIRPTA